MDFITGTDAEIAEALRLLMRTTHSMATGPLPAASPESSSSRRAWGEARRHHPERGKTSTRRHCARVIAREI